MKLMPALLALLSISMSAQTIDLGIFSSMDDPGVLEVRLRASENVESLAYSGGVFTVRYPAVYDIGLEVIPGSSPYQFVFAGPAGLLDGYQYHRFQFSGAVYSVNWEEGVEYPVLSLRLSEPVPAQAYFELVSGDEWTRAYNGNYYQELKGKGMQGGFYRGVAEAPILAVSVSAEKGPDAGCRVWPNPAKASVVLERPDAVGEGPLVFDLLDRHGKMVYRGTFDGKHTNLDLRALPAATYWIRVHADTGQVFNCSVVLME